jgi:NTP pyrophosphatase (non-canonical NTP hydrolase)
MSDNRNPDQPSPHQAKSLGSSVTLKELTNAMNAFVAAMGWYKPDSPCEQSPRNIAVSLSLEAAEVLEHFQWGENANSEALSEELADVLLYLLQLAYLTGIDLGDAVMEKLSVNYERFGPRPT